MQFFDEFREASRRFGEGVCMLEAPAAPGTLEALAALAGQAGRPVPSSLIDFFRVHDGASLFHDDIVIHDTRAAAKWLRGRGAESDEDDADVPPDFFPFAEASSGDRYFLDASGRVFQWTEESSSLVLAATSLERMLARWMALGKILYDREGEYRDGVFDEQGDSLRLETRVKLARRAIAVDKRAALGYEELGRVLRDMDQEEEAAEAFGQAASLDPNAIWSAFDQGRILFAKGAYEPAEQAFVQAAEGDRTHVYAPFFWAWALLSTEAAAATEAMAAATATPPDARAKTAEAAGRHRAAQYRATVRQLAPDFSKRQVEAAEAALADGAADEAQVFLRLALAVEPGHLAALSLRRSLPNFGV